MRSFYTVAQIMEFMDVEIDLDSEILVNNKPADLDTQVYENFSLEWEVITYRTPLEEIEGVYRQPQEELQKKARKLPQAWWLRTARTQAGRKMKGQGSQKKQQRFLEQERQQEQKELHQQGLRKQGMQPQKKRQKRLKQGRQTVKQGIQA